MDKQPGGRRRQRGRRRLGREAKGPGTALRPVSKLHDPTSSSKSHREILFFTWPHSSCDLPRGVCL